MSAHITDSTSSSDVQSPVNGDSNPYPDSAVVWVRLGQSWWPGTVVSLDRCPQDFVADLKKTPIAVVKFFNESGIFDIHKQEHIYPYNCERKREFIKKGINLKSIQSKEELFKKFESDVMKAQKLTGGSEDIFIQIEEETNKRRIDYSNLGFGGPKPKKKKEEDAIKKLSSCISQAVRYKKEKQVESPRLMKPEHKTVIMEQPIIEDMAEDVKKACNSYTCTQCGYSCTRIGVILWHNKSHLKTTLDYDTGVKRRKIRARPYKNRRQKKVAEVDYTKTNGHAETSAEVNNVDKTKQLLDDWDDADESGGENGDQVNNGDIDTDGESDDEIDGENDQSLKEDESRTPARGRFDLNSAFDALLANTPTSNGSPSNQVSTYDYKNNDSDSDKSDWEKYYNRSDDDSENEETVNNGEGDSDLEEGANGTAEIEQANNGEEVVEAGKESENGEEEDISSSTNIEDEVNASEEEESTIQDESEQLDDRSTASSPSNNAGSAYMLVAVDAHGNNVPMPALTDRNHSSNLVAVEASMEDGTSRTLYIDPAYLEPNVDLSNLMLHIDNSGQETVIIPPSSSQETESLETTTTTSQSSTSDCTSVTSTPTHTSTEQASAVKAAPVDLDHNTSTVDQVPSDSVDQNPVTTDNTPTTVDQNPSDSVPSVDKSPITAESSSPSQQTLSSRHQKVDWFTKDKLVEDQNDTTLNSRENNEETLLPPNQSEEIIPAMIATSVNNQEPNSPENITQTASDAYKDGKFYKMDGTNTNEEMTFQLPEEKKTSEFREKDLGLNSDFLKSEGEGRGLNKDVPKADVEGLGLNRNVSIADGEDLCLNRDVPKAVGEGLGLNRDVPKVDGEGLGLNRDVSIADEKGLGLDREVPKAVGEGLGLNSDVPKSEGGGLGLDRDIPKAEGEGDCEMDDEDLPDILGSLPTGKLIKYPEGTIVWALVKEEAPGVNALWWPAYVTHYDADTDNVTLNFIGNDKLPQNVVRNVGIGVQHLYCDLPFDLMSKGIKKVLSAYSAGIRFTEYKRKNKNAVYEPPQFFNLPDAEQEMLIADEEEIKAKLKLKRKRNSKSTSSELDFEFSDEQFQTPESSINTTSLSARETKKLESAFKSRRRETESMLRFMLSADCFTHLVKILNGEIPSALHTEYQIPSNREGMKWSLHWGPLKAYEHWHKVCKAVNHLRDTLEDMDPLFQNPEQYVILVWLPEAIRHALRVILKVPENELDRALVHGYKENVTERKARKLLF